MLYDSPAKRHVRLAFFKGLDSSLARWRQLSIEEPIEGIYLPGKHNWEAPLYRGRDLDPRPIERVPRVAEFICDPGVSTHPIDRELLFRGSVRDFVAHRVPDLKNRLAFANLDFEGQLAYLASDLLAVFSIFPAAAGGHLGITTFASRDTDTISEGVLFTNYVNAATKGAVMPQLDQVQRKWDAYVAGRSGRHRMIRHAQIARDFGILWRLILGMGLVSHPQFGAGKVRSKLRDRLRLCMWDFEFRAERIRSLTNTDSLFHLSSPELEHIFENVDVHVLPVALTRYVYQSERGSNRMTTWYITFARVSNKTWRQCAISLWNLYRTSQLRYIDIDGKVQVF